MAVFFQCPCGNRLQVLNWQAGQPVHCPACNRMLVVRMPEANPAPGSLPALHFRWPAVVGAALVVLVGLGFALVKTLPLLDRQQPTLAVNLTKSPDPSTARGPAGSGQQSVPAKLEHTPVAGHPVIKAPAPPAEIPGKNKVLPDKPAKPKTKAGYKPYPLHVNYPLKRIRAGYHIYQEVVVSRDSNYRILGSVVGQKAAYAFLSSFQAGPEDADGTVHVQQKVEGVRLDNVELAMQAQLNELLQKTQGNTFKMALSPQMEVTHFEGAKEAVQVFGGANPLGGQSFLLWSFMDQDGWKELAQLSFFQPEKPLRKGEKWSRPMTHGWGPLGHWVGRVSYADTGEQGGRERFDFHLDLKYQPPRRPAADLPFQIVKAAFLPPVARGTIDFDAAKRRVVSAQETFHVKGALTISFLGTPATVDMDEQQVFKVRIFDHNPWHK